MRGEGGENVAKKIKWESKKRLVEEILPFCFNARKMIWVRILNTFQNEQHYLKSHLNNHTSMKYLFNKSVTKTFNDTYRTLILQIWCQLILPVHQTLEHWRHFRLLGTRPFLLTLWCHLSRFLMLEKKNAIKTSL